MFRKMKMPSMARALGLVALISLVGCSAAEAHSPPSYYPTSGAGEGALTEQVVMESEPARAQSAVDRHAVADSGAARRGEAQAEEEPRRGQLLIYTGALVLAIYDVEATQNQVVALVEEMGGYISRRSSYALTARVPAPKFREAMAGIGAQGDVLDRSWDAQDVSDQVRDLDIRLRNARGLRDRLEALLDEVETIEEALQIEKELERITLEIERIRGQLQSFEDRIAYSTIQVDFRSRRVDEVPDDEFLLPFRWLNTLGLQSLLRAPEVHR